MATIATSQKTTAARSAGPCEGGSEAGICVTANTPIATDTRQQARVAAGAFQSSNSRLSTTAACQTETAGEVRDADQSCGDERSARSALTLSIGASCYLNIPERVDALEPTGYEHFGVTVTSAAQLHAVWDRLTGEQRDIQLTPVEESADGSCSFRFRHLLPLAIEVQYFASAKLG